MDMRPISKVEWTGNPVKYYFDNKIQIALACIVNSPFCYYISF